jgi:hypothetical protein
MCGPKTTSGIFPALAIFQMRSELTFSSSASSRRVSNCVVMYASFGKLCESSLVNGGAIAKSGVKFFQKCSFANDLPEM